MDKKLLKDGVIKYLAGVLLIGLLLYLPAGTLSWRDGWIFMALLFIPMLLSGILMYFKAPDLLRSRLNAKEKQSEQKEVIGYSGLMFLAAFILAYMMLKFGLQHAPTIPNYYIHQK